MAEIIQRRVGKIILGVYTHVSNPFVYDELRWILLKARLDMRRLMFWWKIISVGDHRLVKKVYTNTKHTTKGWCVYTKQLLEELGLGEKWNDQSVWSKGE